VFCCGVYLPWPVGGLGREVMGNSSKKLVELGPALFGGCGGLATEALLKDDIGGACVDGALARLGNVVFVGVKGDCNCLSDGMLLLRGGGGGWVLLGAWEG
jgi:hypothetical protein